MGPRQRIPKRGEIYSIDPNPIAGREMKDRHSWIVVISTVAHGARAAGLAVPVSGGGVTGVAVCSHARSFDIRARLLDGSASYVGVADPPVVDEIAARTASVIDPAG